MRRKGRQHQHSMTLTPTKESSLETDCNAQRHKAPGQVPACLKISECVDRRWTEGISGVYAVPWHWEPLGYSQAGMSLEYMHIHTPKPCWILFHRRRNQRGPGGHGPPHFTKRGPSIYMTPQIMQRIPTLESCTFSTSRKIKMKRHNNSTNNQKWLHNLTANTRKIKKSEGECFW